MDYKRQTSPNTGIEKFLETQRIDTKIQSKIEELILPLKEENEKLKDELNTVKRVSDDNKYSTVRMQLQMLHFLGTLKDLKNKGTLEQKGLLFSVLLNRHPQRARKPFSSINELIFSSRKAEAKNIKRDLLKVKEVFEGFGLKKEAKAVNNAIQEINEKHALD